MNFFVSFYLFVVSYLQDWWSRVVSNYHDFVEYRTNKGILEAIRHEIQKNAYARVWGVLATACGAVAMVFMKLTQRFNFTGFPHNKEARHAVIYFCLVIVIFGSIHAFIIILGSRVRKFWIVRVTPHPLVMGLGATVTAFLPIACIIDGSMVDENLDKWALICACFFTLEFFFTHITILPAYDYMVVHTCLSIVSSIVLSLTSKNNFRPMWMTLMAIGSASFLGIHHWINIPSPMIDDGFNIELDGRAPQHEEWITEDPHNDFRIEPRRVARWKIILKNKFTHGFLYFVFLVALSQVFGRQLNPKST